MHEWHTEQNRNPLTLIDEFTGFEFNTDYDGNQKVSSVKITQRVFSNSEEAISYVTQLSYGGNTAYLTSYTTKKLTKAFQNAFSVFMEKYNDYLNFKDNLTIAYGRTSSKVTCPSCKSSISLKYGKRFKVCPVCGSDKIISDSNWKIRETKKQMCINAAYKLSKEAEKNDVTFVCGIEWHC